MHRLSYTCIDPESPTCHCWRPEPSSWEYKSTRVLPQSGPLLRYWLQAAWPQELSTSYSPLLPAM